MSVALTVPPVPLVKLDGEAGAVEAEHDVAAVNPELAGPRQNAIDVTFGSPFGLSVPDTVADVVEFTAAGLTERVGEFAVVNCATVLS